MNRDQSNDINELFYKRYFGQLTEEENNQLVAWQEEDGKNRKAINHLDEIVSKRYDDPTYIHAREMKQDIIANGFAKPIGRERSLFGSMLRVAAVITLALGLGYFMLQYDSATNADPQVAEMVIKYNPPGRKSRINLPDGSVVWLNADSKLSYQKGFTDSLRLLELEGEAFFEVSKDKNRPFIVQSGNVSTQALGTSFNIKFYNDEEDIEVSLLTGKVSVTTTDSAVDRLYYLEPYEELSITRANSKVTKREMSGNGVTAWKDNILRFEGASFEEVMASLQRWYGVTIDASGYGAKDWKYNSEFQNQSLERVLTRMGYSQGFGFTIDNKLIKIYDE